MNRADQKMQEYLAKHPFLQETAAVQQGVAQAIRNAVSPMEFPVQEEIKKRTQEGLPLLQNEALQEKIGGAAAESLPQALTELLAVAVPEPLAEALQTLAQWAGMQPSEKLWELIRLVITQNDEKLNVLLQAEGLQGTVVRTVIWQLVDVLVPVNLKDYEFWQKLGWTRNYCPVCGRQPIMAHLRKEKEGRARFLVCDGCHTEWPFARVGCAYCGNEDLTKMHILEPEGQSAIRLDVCDKCHAYLKTYNEEGEEGIYLQDWATLHFDLLGEEQNLIKKGSVLLESK